MNSPRPIKRTLALRGLRTAPRFQGFTLLELMIALVVVAILATVAIPQYTAFVQRSRITDATSQLNDLRIRMEQAFQDNRRYDVAGNCAVDPTIPVFDASRDPFQFTCVFVAGALGGYTLTAAGNAAKNMGSFTYALTVNPATGALTRSTGSVPATWLPLPVPNTCWQVRKAGKCS